MNDTYHFEREFEYQGEKFGYDLDGYKPLGVFNITTGEDIRIEDTDIYQAALEDAAQYIVEKHEDTMQQQQEEEKDGKDYNNSL